jgi:hypothetical protein
MSKRGNAKHAKSDRESERREAIRREREQAKARKAEKGKQKGEATP